MASSVAWAFRASSVARAFGPASVARAFRPAIMALWLAGAVVTWNMAFDAHIVKGARDYVDRQQVFVEGRGPRQDMEQSMAAARAAGLRAAGFWTTVELIPGLALVVAMRLRSRRRPARPAGPPTASR
jgi:hypothetical protein